MGYGETILRGYGAVVAPLMDPHLLAHEGDARGWAVMNILAADKAIHRNSGLVPVGDGGDDVFRPKGGIDGRRC